MIGRLPNRSDNTPSKGEKKNCISAKTTANRALHFAASVNSPPRKSKISLGSTGIIKPIARMSRVTVTRIKMTAAGRDFMTVEHERNVVGAVGSAGGHARKAVAAASAGAREHPGGSASPKRMAKTQVSGGRAACQRVEDKAFH